VPTLSIAFGMLWALMAKSKQPGSHEETLDELLDIVANAREELVAVERRLETLRADIAKSQKRKDGSGKKS
jgi:cell division septum initiation protein DivIVA